MLVLASWLLGARRLCTSDLHCNYVYYALIVLVMHKFSRGGGGGGGREDGVEGREGALSLFLNFFSFLWTVIA